MGSLNINRNLSDQFYRYKMPKLLAKVEGKGNGIKTVIVNMVDIAKSLNRPPMYPTKYFGCVLGAQVNCDVKNERYIVNGSHDSAKLQDLLDGFIKKYVLCAACDNPETILMVHAKKGTITSTCKACGYTGNISLTDKLSTYIIKCPPDQQTAPGASVSKKSKKKDKKGENGRSSPHDSDEFNGNGIEQNGDEEDDDDWCDVTAGQMGELTTGAAKLTMNADLEKSDKERLTIFYKFIGDRLETDVIDVALQKEILAEAERLEVKDKALGALCELMFKDPAKIQNKIKTNRNFFLRFTADSTKAQKYLLRGLECTVEGFPNELLPRVPMLLKTFYDLDILDEKVLLDWASKKKTSSKGIASQIQEKAAPFIKWLREAEEEDDSDSEEEDDDEDDVEVVYDERSRPDKILEVKEEPKPSPKKIVTEEKSAEDDIDIDAI